MAVFNAEKSAGFVPDGARIVECRDLVPRLRGPSDVSSNRESNGQDECWETCRSDSYIK
jgi:hypothetical protein